MAEAGPLDEFQRARVDVVRGSVAFASGPSGDAPALLLKAARRLESFDLELARETYLIAWCAAVTAEHLTGADVYLEICRAVRALPPPPGPPRPLDLLLDGLALLGTDGRAAAIPTLQRAASAHTGIRAEDVLRWGLVSANAAVWDYEGMHAVSARQVQLLRDVGALAQLPLYLSALGLATAWIGDFATTASLIAEANTVAAAIGSPIAPLTELRLRSLQGREAETSALIAHAIEPAAISGQGLAAIHAHWAAAVLNNGLGRYEEAMTTASRAREDAAVRYACLECGCCPSWSRTAARAGHAGPARDALKQLAETTQPSGTDSALGIEARCRALLTDGADADDLYREAIDRLGCTELRPELARAHLLYREWLRRQGRRLDAREQLRTAHDTLTAIGMEAFAERARRELAATGETVRKRSTGIVTTLTAQEALIARLARDGRAPMRRSAPSCSCPPGRSNGTCARYLPNSASGPATS